MDHLIRAVLLDLDGVVVFTDKYHYLGWKRLADEQGWAFDERLNHQLRGIPRLASLQVILDHNNVTATDEEKESCANRKNGYYKELLETINDDDLYPGVVEFLESLQARGVKLGLCSSSRNAATVLEKLDLARFFEAVVTGHDITHAKPDPEIFLLGAEKLGVPAFHCIVFEDAQSGVEAGLAARMKVIGVGTEELLPNAPAVIDDYGAIDVDALLDAGRPTRITPEPWRVTETEFNPKRAQYWETLFALTNGYMGLRGTYEEDDPRLAEHVYPGFFVNGIYDYEPYDHVVSFPGYPHRRQVMLNLCDWRIINLIVDGERFSMFDGKVSDYRRQLDMRRGRLIRELTWESPRGKKVAIYVERFVCMVHKHNAFIRYHVRPLNFDGEITFESVIKCKARSGELKDDHLEVVETGSDDEIHYAVTRPTTADFRVGMAFGHHVYSIFGSAPRVTGRESQRDGDDFIERFTINARRDEQVSLDKHACVHTSIETVTEEVRSSAVAGVREALRREHIEGHQNRFWADYWNLADIEIEGDVGDQMAVRFAMFHLRQSNPEDDHRSISACGMTGDHYWGHVFWDTEMYVSPHFLYTQPETVRPLLMYRYHLLDRARERARQMGGTGALFSWNSISGEECGVVYEAATAEYHLVSDIAFAIRRYVAATGDTGFLHDHGAEILFETARFLADRGKFIPTRGHRFCINVVCGPDEYGCGVNNNCYTNMLAQWHFRYAAKVYDRMQADAPEQFASLTERIGLTSDERDFWQRAADNMYIPYSNELSIHAQDDSFLYLDPVDMSKVPLHTDLRNENHPLNLWRMQVAKQADVVLLMLVLSDQFTLQQKQANYEFYEPRTNHGSSLSTSIHSIVASEIGKHDEAYRYFRHSAYMDLNDFKDNTAGGVHSACLGGTWMAVINGFAGMRDEPRGLSFAPMLPSGWTSYSFKLRYCGRLIAGSVTSDKATYELLDGPELEFHANGKPVSISPAQSVLAQSFPGVSSE